jgi:ABC-type Zn uptake system ZnuABC Zn-binding protein ZnuA
MFLIIENEYQYQIGETMKIKLALFSVIVIATLILTACGGATAPSAEDGLQVLATTSIVADVVQQVGGDYVNVTLLLPLGTDPHTFVPRPQDAVSLAETQIIFANGAGLEEFLQPLLESTEAADKLVEVSDGIELLAFEENHHEGEATEGEEHQHEDGDPHTWMDPNNVLIWVDNIAASLSTADPEHVAYYQANAEAYAVLLRDLDAWIHSQVEQIPVENRMIISDHAVLGYLAEEYGFTQLGAITGSFSTEATPTVQELALLEDEIRVSGVKAIFVTEPGNQAIAEQIARDTGVQVVWLYHASLTDETGPVPTYLEFMRYNISSIVVSLK